MIIRERKRNRKIERNQQIVELRAAGTSYKKIAEQFGISVVRVRQILENEAIYETDD